MNLSTIFKAYDVRGVYPSEIDEDIAYKIGGAFVLFLKSKIKNLKSKMTIVVGRDCRLSSPSLNEALIRGIHDRGVEVLDVGLVSTPTFYFAVRHLRASAGIQVSASHNPKEYNGFKIVLADEKGIIKVGLESGLDKIRDLVISMLKEIRSLKEIEPPKIKKISGIQEAEIDEALRLVPVSLKRPLKIVADPANAMGAQYLEALFSRLPQIKPIRMNFELDGNFPAHLPNPLIFETLKGLQERVKKEGADLGLAPDGDGDRVFFLNEKAEVIPTSHVTALISKELLRQNLGKKILYDIRYSWTPKAAIEKYKGIPVVSRVGHAYISEALREEGGIFAGESSGHYFFKDTGFAESPLLTILYVLKIMEEEKKPLSELIAPLISSFESGEVNFRFENREKFEEIMGRIEDKYRAGEISKIDGLAVDFPDWRFSLRPSNTEPLFRLNVEAKTEELMEEKTEELVSLLAR